MKPFHTLALIGAAVLGVFLGKEAKKNAPAPAPGQPLCPKTDSRILLIGDSYVGIQTQAGLGYYMSKLAVQCSTTFSFEGKIGATVTYWVPRLGSILDMVKPNVVLLCLGGNDFGRNDPELVALDIATIVGLVKERPNTMLFWIAPPTTPFPDNIGVRGMWKKHIPDNDVFHSELLAIPRASSDPLGHPTAEGYKIWSKSIWLWLAAKLRVRP
jgi:lysophospholipase L1-like esterase